MPAASIPELVRIHRGLPVRIRNVAIGFFANRYHFITGMMDKERMKKPVNGIKNTFFP
jgi:hypothetical protein